MKLKCLVEHQLIDCFAPHLNLVQPHYKREGERGSECVSRLSEREREREGVSVCLGYQLTVLLYYYEDNPVLQSPVLYSVQCVLIALPHLANDPTLEALSHATTVCVCVCVCVCVYMMAMMS